MSPYLPVFSWSTLLLKRRAPVAIPATILTQTLHMHRTERAAKTSKRAAGFTLVEVLIVVVILAVLAATIIPQFASSTNDAKAAALQFNLNSIRSQIELYKFNHADAVPTLVSGALPQLTSATDANGDLGAAGPSFPFGPYIQTQLPVEPFSGVNTVTAMTTFPPTAATAAGGWFYNATTGQVAANNANYLNF